MSALRFRPGFSRCTLAPLTEDDDVAVAGPIARVAVQPAEAAIQVGDSVCLTALTRDSAGRPMRDIAIRWFQSGGHFEVKVNSTGLVQPVRPELSRSPRW
jgi:hypothetical protein